MFVQENLRILCSQYCMIERNQNKILGEIWMNNTILYNRNELTEYMDRERILIQSDWKELS